MTELTSIPGGAARRAPKGLLPSTWEGHALNVEYRTGSGAAATMVDVTLLGLFPFGPVLGKNGAKTALSWDSIILVELTGA